MNSKLQRAELFGYLYGNDNARAGRAMRPMLGLIKIDIADIKAAYEGTA